MICKTNMHKKLSKEWMTKTKVNERLVKPKPIIQKATKPISVQIEICLITGEKVLQAKYPTHLRVTMHLKKV